MSRSPPTAEQGTLRRLAQKQGPLGGKGPRRRPGCAQGCLAPNPGLQSLRCLPGLTLHQVSWNPSWHRGRGGGTWRAGARRPVQAWLAACRGGSSRAADSPGAPGAGNRLRSSPAPGAGEAEPVHRVPGGTGAAHTGRPPGPPRGWALGCGCRFYTLLLPRACRGQSLAPFLTCSAGPGAGVPTASSPSAAGLCPGEGRPRRTEFCTGGEGHGPRNTGLSGRLDKQSQCHPPRGCAMIARRSPEGFQVTGHRSSGLEPGPGAGRHSPRPGPGPAPAAERPSAHTVPSRRPHPARLPKDSVGEGGSSGWGALPCNSPQ